jgi:hypothetical protein
MAHFAKIENGLVTQVIVVGDEYQEMYSEWRKEFGEIWIQTSYNNNIRKNYAGIGYTYDEVRDAFIAPKPDNATGFEENTCQWIVPEVEIEA